MSNPEAKKIVAAIEPPAKDIRKLLNDLCTVKMTDKQYAAWEEAKRDYNEWFFLVYGDLREKSGLEKIKAEEEPG